MTSTICKETRVWHTVHTMQARSCSQLASTESKITCPSHWPIYRRHSQLRQSCCPNLSCDQFSQSCLAGGKIAPEMYILPHNAKQECIFYLIK